MSKTRRTLTFLFIIAINAIGVLGDGTGLIGWGKTLYNPPCTFACRYVLRKQVLACTPVDSTANHGTSHNPVSTPPSCFVKDPVFLKTMALCIDTYCPMNGDLPMSLVEDYWATHLGTGTLGTSKYVPAMSYHDALAAAREEETHASSNTSSATGNSTGHDSHSRRLKVKVRHGDSHGTTESAETATSHASSSLPTTVGGKAALNVTSFVDHEQWQLSYNYLYDFEANETGHSSMTISIVMVAIFLPIPLSLLRLIPGVARSRLWNEIQTRAVYPAAFGNSHRTPVAGAIVPTRGQAMYIFLISFLNIILLLTPYVHHQPQASFTSLGSQTLSIIGNRAGSMAMGNVVALFLFAARNNVLMYITDWSYGTYLFLHRWLGYWAIIQTVIHSFMLMAYYIKQEMYLTESIREYWIWGIVSTVTMCAIFPTSFLWVRQKFYEFFLATHVILSLLMLIGYYYHIWYLYTYNWGYEIWMFVAGGIWGADRVVRLARMAFHGSNTAVVSRIRDVDGEYLRIDIEGKHIKNGVVYLCFPTLGWRFWETHPFSVAISSAHGEDGITVKGNIDVHESTSTPKSEEPEKETSQLTAPPNRTTAAATTPAKHSTTTLIARTRTGVTKQLAARMSKMGRDAQGSTRIRVLIDGPYHHSGRVTSQLAPCSSILCIVGGVGITACLPYLEHKINQRPAKLFWSSRKRGLVSELEPVLAFMPPSVQVETSVGDRLDLDAILLKELTNCIDGDGLLGVIVCGPPGMADDVRSKIGLIARMNVRSRSYVLVDEAFSW